MKLLLSPHDDDFALFAAFTCMREKPTILVVTDSYIQPHRGEVGCSAVERAKESEKSARILGCCEIERLVLSDEGVTEELIARALRTYLLTHTPFSTIYVPALQGGNVHHDMVYHAARKVFALEKLTYYPTYTKTDLYTIGETEVVPSTEELRAKVESLDCFKSQHKINLPHFKAVVGKSEWLNDKKRLHIGCGRNIKEGYINVDRMNFPGVDKYVDLVKDGNLGFDLNTFDEVFSEDVLEHLPPEHSVLIMNKIWSVLKPGGFMEHFVPNAGSRNDFGSPSHLSHWNLQCFEHFDVDSYRWEKDREFEGFIGGFRKVFAEAINSIVEEGGVSRCQALHVKYEAVK